MTNVQIIPGNFQITDPNWPVYKPMKVLTSDDFSGGDEVVGSVTSAALGGEPMTWGGAAGSWRREGGKLHTPTTQGEIYLPISTPDISVSVTVDKGPFVSGRESFVNIMARADSARANRVVLEISSESNLLRFKDRVDGTQIPGKWKTEAYQPGDRITLTVKGNTATALVNGEPIIQQTTDVTGTGDVALSTYPSGNDLGAVLDDLVIAEI